MVSFGEGYKTLSCGHRSRAHDKQRKKHCEPQVELDVFDTQVILRTDAKNRMMAQATELWECRWEPKDLKWNVGTAIHQQC
jgi:hypothetical protein